MGDNQETNAERLDAGALYERLCAAFASPRAADVAIDSVVAYEAVSGKLMPATYADVTDEDGEYSRLKDRKKPNGVRNGFVVGTAMHPVTKQPVRCVLVDSVSSQSARSRGGLLDLVLAGELDLPLVTGPQKADGLPITSLDAPHGAADAVWRDGLYPAGHPLAGKPFWSDGPGFGLRTASVTDLRAMVELFPYSLVRGNMFSRPKDAGTASTAEAKRAIKANSSPRKHASFARSYFAEICGYEPTPAMDKPGTRIDPFGLQGSQMVKSTDGANWEPADAKDKGAKKITEMGHGTVIGLGLGSVSCPGGIYRTSAVQLSMIRRLGFGPDRAQASVARVYVAALAVLADVVGGEQTALRSGCVLNPVSAQRRWLAGLTGTTEVVYDFDAAMGAFTMAASAARAAGFTVAGRLDLIANESLRKAIELSYDLAVDDAADTQEG